MQIFLDERQLIFWVVSINVVIAYLIFDAPWAKRRNEEDIGDPLSNKSALDRYLLVALYSAFLAILMRSLNAETIISSKTHVPTFVTILLLSMAQLFIDEDSFFAPRFRKLLVFTSISVFATFSAAIWAP
jgi:hypothetical protein